MTKEAIEKLDDPYLEKAAFVPPAPQKAYEIFFFLRTNIPHCAIPSGYGIIGVDKDRLERMAERRGIELIRFDQFVELYIEKAVSSWQTQQSASN
jgi:hypothetical protein